jgi:hypothetical protein
MDEQKHGMLTDAQYEEGCRELSRNYVGRNSERVRLIELKRILQDEAEPKAPNVRPDASLVERADNAYMTAESDFALDCMAAAVRLVLDEALAEPTTIETESTLAFRNGDSAREVVAEVMANRKLGLLAKPQPAERVTVEPTPETDTRPAGWIVKRDGSYLDQLWSPHKERVEGMAEGLRAALDIAVKG